MGNDWYGFYYGQQATLKLTEGHAVADLGCDYVSTDMGRVPTETHNTISFDWSYEDGQFTISNESWSYASDASEWMMASLASLSIKANGSSMTLTFLMQYSEDYSETVDVTFTPAAGLDAAVEALTAGPLAVWSDKQSVQLYMQFNLDGTGIFGVVATDWSNNTDYLSAHSTFTWSVDGEKVTISLAQTSLTYESEEYDYETDEYVIVEKTLDISGLSVELDVASGEYVYVTLLGEKLTFALHDEELSPRN